MKDTKNSIDNLIAQIYGNERVEDIFKALNNKLIAFKQEYKRSPQATTDAFPLSEKDSFLITYGDQFVETGKSPLACLHEFLQTEARDILSGVHILPFFPYSSDDGFAVIDYLKVDEQKGTWEDVQRIGKDYKLMMDLVANHISSQSVWFKKFLAGESPYTEYFISLDAATNLNHVIRPRTTPLLTPVETKHGLQYVWTTFGIDQIDLNYQNPAVLLEMVDVLLAYVRHGANLIRLDAIAFLWKIPGTSCIHLPQTHAVVKLLRAILDEIAPEVLIITETNVPHEENISYFGESISMGNHTDEAQLVYQFPLAPLILHTFITGNAGALMDWAGSLPPVLPGTAFFNFIASHDGIGLRPVENLLPAEDVQALVRRTQDHGGRVSYKANPDGGQSAYELNITLFDALNDPTHPQAVDVARFLASQAIMLSLAGVPGIYVHSLFGSHNCLDCAAETGRDRSINREKFQLTAIQSELSDTDSLKSRVFDGYRSLLSIRKGQQAFHPMAAQRILKVTQNVFCVLRTPGQGNPVLCLINVTGEQQRIVLAIEALGFSKQISGIDLLSGNTFIAPAQMKVSLAPYQCRWIELHN